MNALRAPSVVTSLNRVVLNACTWNNEPSDRVCAHRPMTVLERTSLTPADKGATAGEGLNSCFQSERLSAGREAGLRHHGIAAAAPVGTHASGKRVPAVVGRPSRPIARIVVIGPLREHTIRDAADRSAMANGCLIALEGPGAHCDRRAPCSTADLVTMLMTPFMALAPQTVPPGPRMTSIRSMSCSSRSSPSQTRPRIHGCRSTGHR